MHDVAYGYHNPEDPVEVMNVRLTAFGRTRRGAAQGAAQGAAAAPEPVEIRPAWFDPHAPEDTPVFDRSRLRPGVEFVGSAIVEQLDATTVVHPGDRVRVDAPREPHHHPRRSMTEMTATATTAPASFELDAVGLEILSNALRSITDECFVALMKSAYSTNIKERRDHSASIMDVRGRLVAQSEQSLPLHIASMSGLMESVLAKFGDDLHDGDLFVANDPYVAGGTHLPDVNLALPVFSAGTLVGFVCNIAHHADIGGMAPGSMAGGMTEIYQEGLRIPVVRLFRRGELQQDLLDLLLLNVRVPHERRGDYFAQIAACRLGARRLLELVEARGAATVTQGFDLMMERAERRLRDAVATVPDGVYEFEDQLDSDGTDRFDLPIRIRIEVAGDRIRFDFAGTSEQVPGNMNTTVNATHASACYALKALLDPGIPNSQGVLDVAEVSAPPGTIVNAVFPASVAARANTCQRIVDVIFGALAMALPDRVPAAANGANTTAVFAGTNPETGIPYVYLETLGGGMGARPDRDGKDAVQIHMTNTSNLPVEAIEMEYPLLVEEYGLVPDSGGAGRWRGGLGLRRVVRPLGHDCTFNGLGERFRHEPWGLAGGAAGGARAVRDPRGQRGGADPRRQVGRHPHPRRRAGGHRDPGGRGLRSAGRARSGGDGGGSAKREVQPRVPRPALPLRIRPRPARRPVLTSPPPGSSQSPGSRPRR